MAKYTFGPGRTTLKGLVGSAIVMVVLLAAAGARAQPEMTPEPLQPFSAAELETLVGPIALYVDDLVGIVLPASAYPLQIVEAARFLDASEDDPALRPDDDWDEAIVALLNYPEVLRMMNADLDWTADLGEAFVYQQGDVMDAIQRFRQRALAAGNLHSDEYQTVRQVGGFIEIVPADRQVVHVPYYEPERVSSYYAGPRLDYYPYGYPLYYYPYPLGHSFGPDYFWGVSTAYVVRWRHRHVRVCPDSYAGHPYYGRRYDSRYYTRRSHEGDRHRQRDANPWRPSGRWGRQAHRQDNDGRADERPAGARRDTRVRAREDAPARVSTDRVSVRPEAPPARVVSPRQSDAHPAGGGMRPSAPAPARVERQPDSAAARGAAPAQDATRDARPPGNDRGPRSMDTPRSGGNDRRRQQD